MRRLIPTKDADYLSKLKDSGLNIAPLPQDCVWQYDTLFRQEMVDQVDTLDEDGDIDWGSGFINNSVSWFFYPSNYPLGVSSAYNNDVYCSVCYDDGPIDFPSDITTQEQLVDYLMQGIPEECVSAAYIDEVQTTVVDFDGTNYPYVMDYTELYEDGKGVEVGLSAAFAPLSIDEVAIENAKTSDLRTNSFYFKALTQDVSGAVTSNLRAALNMNGKAVQNARLEFPTFAVKANGTNCTFSNGVGTITTTKEGYQDNLYCLTIKFHDRLNTYTVLEQFSLLTNNEYRWNIPVYCDNNSNMWTLNTLKIEGYISRGDDHKAHLTATLYEGTTNMSSKINMASGSANPHIEALLKLM